MASRPCVPIEFPRLVEYPLRLRAGCPVHNLILDMILHGLFPSRGWKIGETIYRDGDTVRYACFPIEP